MTAAHPPPGLIPAGLHPARCSGLIDLGAHVFKAGSQPTRRLWISFALWCPGEDAPRTLGREFALSMGPRGHLRKFLESWRGLTFVNDDAAYALGRDLSPLLHKPAHIHVQHTRSEAARRTYAGIVNAYPLPAEMRVDLPELQWRPTQFDLSQPDRRRFLSLPPFLQKKIRASQTWTALTEQASRHSTTHQPA